MSALATARPLRAVLALLGLAALFLASLAIGATGSSPLAGFIDGEPDLLAVSRLPRTLAVVIAGAGLAIAGLVMQALARNRFVEPATTGTAQWAMLGILVTTLLWPEAPLVAKTALACVAAFGGTALFLTVAGRLPPTQPMLVPLFGLVYSGIVEAAATFVGWQADLLQYLAIWMTGEFSGVLRGRYELLWLAGGGVMVAWWVADRLSILALGRDTSVGLGLDYAAMMRVGLAIVCVVSAVTVSVVGLVPFVGLVVPNLVSRIIGDDVRTAVPWVAGGGAALVLCCDILARLLRHPYEIPVGTVLGVVGALVFLWLLFDRNFRG